MRLRAHIGLLSLVTLAIAPCTQQSAGPGAGRLAHDQQFASVDRGSDPAEAPSALHKTNLLRADLTPQGVAERERGKALDRIALQRFERRARTLSLQERRALMRTIEETCAQYRVAPALVIAVIEVESAYDPHIVSPVGALGLMQVMLPTGQEMAQRLDIPWRGPQTLFDPEVNIKIGTAYLRQLIDRYGSVRTALVAYNWGPGRIDRRIKRGSTLPVVYADQVTRAYSRATAGS